MIAQATTFTHDVPETLNILADTMLNPLILPNELDKQRASASWEIAEIESKPELIMPELLHEVAYRDNTLGRPLLCPPAQLNDMSAELLRAYHADWYRPERMVIAAAGVDHDEFAALVDKTITPSLQNPVSHIKPPPAAAVGATSRRPQDGFTNAFSTSSSSNASVINSIYPQEPPFQVLSHAEAQYTGGARYIPDEGSEFTHLYVAFESVPVTDLDNTYALAVLQTLLGGGNAFSAGGPGKGMYSRLYTRVLNQHWKVDFCSAFNHSYIDSGLFGMGIAVTPDYTTQAPRIIAQQLESLMSSGASALSEEELRRAKNQLKSSLMMNLESRSMQIEDLARQVLAHGYKTSAEEMCRHIDAVSLLDLQKIATKVLGTGTNPSIVAKGSLHGLGDVRDILGRYGLGRR